MIWNNWQDKNKTDRLLWYFTGAIIAIGILLRIAVYLQCNSMYLDEANVARNIFERSYNGLTAPLNYYQYAPPVFLWIIKTCTLIFGYSEYSYRLYPLLCGLASLLLMLAVLKHWVGPKGMWYPLLLLAVGPIYVSYAQATKQYVPDMFFTLLLLWLALKNTPEKKSAVTLFLIWALAGTLAIWSSMPSVFILAGIGAYYFFTIIQGKDYSKLWFLAGVTALWLLQFALYYVIILRPQANSGYLQNFHKAFFFYWPANLHIFRKDIGLLPYVISTVGGHLVLPVVFHFVCIMVAFFYLWRTKQAKLLLLVVPLILVLFAAALHQYTLIKRVMLFSMPLLLILIGVGMQQLLNIRYALIRFAAIICAVICFINFNALKNFVVPMDGEEMKQSLNYLLQKQIQGNELYVEQYGVPGYVYYTGIHPQKAKWSSLSGAAWLDGGTNLDSLSKKFPATAAMLYGWREPEIMNAQQEAIRRNVALTDSNIIKGSRVYISKRISAP